MRHYTKGQGSKKISADGIDLDRMSFDRPEDLVKLHGPSRYRDGSLPSVFLPRPWGEVIVSELYCCEHGPNAVETCMRLSSDAHASCPVHGTRDNRRKRGEQASTSEGKA